MSKPDPRDEYMLQISRSNDFWQCLVQRRVGWTIVWASPICATAERAFEEGRKAMRRMVRQDRQAIARMTAKKKETK